MSRLSMYPEGGVTASFHISRAVQDGLRTVAQRPPRQSVSQLVSIILEDYLRRRGDLPVVEQEKAAV